MNTVVDFRILKMQSMESGHALVIRVLKKKTKPGTLECVHCLLFRELIKQVGLLSL